MPGTLRVLRRRDRPLALAGLVLRRMVEGPLGDHDRLAWAAQAGATVRRARGHYVVERHGIWVWCRPRTSDLDVALQCVVHTQYAPSVVGVEPEVVVDLGANIGCSALYFAKRWPGARVIAVEPDAANFALLEANIARNGVRVECVRAAVWDAEARVRVLRGSGLRPQWARQVEPGGDVRAITVQRLMQESGVEYIDLLKIDVEGAERRIFAGATPWLDRVGRCAIETHGAEAAAVVAQRCEAHGLAQLHHVGEVTTYCRTAAASGTSGTAT